MTDWRDEEMTRRNAGHIRALSQNAHEAINARHYPGTRQLCVECDAPTGRCEEDSIYVEDAGPLCEECCDKHEQLANLSAAETPLSIEQPHQSKIPTQPQGEGS